MSATIIPFPASSRVEPAREDEDFISSFIGSLQEARRERREFGLTGPEWLQIIGLERRGVPHSEAVQIVVGRR